MIVALEEAKRRLVAMEEVILELGNQLKIEESRERAADLERETMVENLNTKPGSNTAEAPIELLILSKPTAIP